MNGIPYSTWQKNDSESVYDFPSANIPICNITNSVRFCYGLRRLNLNYNGAIIRVRRSRDNAELNIHLDQFGKLDIKTLQDFCQSGNGFVTTWYDQSGNGYHQVQGTAGTQPLIISNGTLITQNGLPIISTAVNRWMLCTTTDFDWVEPMSILIVYRTDISASQAVLDFNSSSSSSIAFAVSNMENPINPASTSNVPLIRFRYSTSGGAERETTLSLNKRKPQLMLIYCQTGKTGSGTSFIDTFGYGANSGGNTTQASIPSSSFGISANGAATHYFAEVICFEGMMNKNNPNLYASNTRNTVVRQYDETLLQIVKQTAKYHGIGLYI
jgi:hypothetical protein